MKIEFLRLQIDTPLAHPQAQNFRPPTWPPSSDWAIILDADGKPQSLYGDSVWALDIWAGKPMKLNFGDGKTRGVKLDKANADLLRACTAWWMYGPRGCRTPGNLAAKHSVIKGVFATCAKEGISAGDLMLFPRVLNELAKSLSKSNFDYAITLLHELLDAREALGFCILDRDGIAHLASLAPNHETEQTAYIPPRIWVYQITRLRECLDEYLKHKDKVEDCFNFCLDAYATNYGSLKTAVMSFNGKYTPFRAPKKPRSGCIFQGAFKDTADRFGVTPMIERWIGIFTEEKGEGQIKKFSQYLDLVSKAGLIYLINFSLMRAEEAWNLRANCLPEPRADESFGKVWLLHGETTKTIQDSDARWVVSGSAQVAVAAMGHIAKMRMRCAVEHDGIILTPEDKVNP